VNEEIIKQIALENSIKESQISKTLSLLEEGNTIPFIARYRKEMTEGLNEDQIRKIKEVYDYQNNLLQRKEDVIRLIDEKGMLSDDLKNQILSAEKLVEVEDLYRPFKEKKKTKATEPIKFGLEPLAKIILSFPDKLYTDKFINENVKTEEDAIQGAKYIIAEYISDNAYYRKWIRNNIFNHGTMVSKIKKDAEDKNKTYEIYYDFSESIRTIKSHRVLAINRAEKENVLKVSLEYDEDYIFENILKKIVKDHKNKCADYVADALQDSLKRLIYPSVEREIRSELTDRSDEDAIKNFSKNLESLLLTPPIKEKIVLGFDPGFTNGCKLAVVDKTGKYLYSTVINPFNGKRSEEISKKTLLEIIKKYNVDIVAIGNGTASRESEKLISDLIKDNNLKIKFVIVSEAGASIYSVEQVAIDEFPNLSPNERSAVSIARRLQDSLSELVKIPPEGIGVGLYQHDVKQKELKESLDFVTEKVVNEVGVNINTASPSILKYVSGISKRNIDKIIEYRDSNGKINSREELKNKKILTGKTYEQAIGFLRIIDGTNPLDKTSIHPESYEITTKLLTKLNLSIDNLGSEELIAKLDNIDVTKYSKELGVDSYTLEDIIANLKQPNRDPREEIDAPILKSDVLSIDDLTIGMKLQGTVRNVVDFGAFVDIGLHNDGLVHISEISDKYIKHPSDVLHVGDIIDVYVKDINKEKGKVSLTMKH